MHTISLVISALILCGRITAEECHFSAEPPTNNQLSLSFHKAATQGRTKKRQRSLPFFMRRLRPPVHQSRQNAPIRRYIRALSAGESERASTGNAAGCPIAHLSAGTQSPIRRGVRTGWMQGARRRANHSNLDGCEDCEPSATPQTARYHSPDPATGVSRILIVNDLTSLPLLR